MMGEDLDGRLPEPIEAAVYYLVCEALTNAAKHAQASKVTVQISCRDRRVLVEVADDGRGAPIWLLDRAFAGWRTGSLYLTVDL